MARWPSRSSLNRACLVLILLLAAGLRFAGIGFEARHPQHYDDRVFVNNVIAMLAAGNADHRYYEYPGLFFYLLAVPIALAQPERIDDPAAYLAARILVALFGVASVALVYALGRRLAAPELGLTAALLLAVSPHEVAAAHTNRPDVVLQTMTLAACLCLLRVGKEWRGDLRFGLWLGIGTAVKFTGFMLFPSYVVARVRAPGPRLARMAAVAAVAALVVLAATPYALVRPEAYLGGVSHQLGAHYLEPVESSPYLEHLATYGLWLVRPLGVPAVVLAMLGTGFALRNGLWVALAVLVHLPVTLLVMSSAGIIAPRFLIPALGGFWLAAGLGIRALARGSMLATLALSLLAAATPLRESFDRLRPLLQPSPRDAALDWIESNLKTGSRILETRGDAPSELRAKLIGADPRRYELLFHPSSRGGLPLLAPNMDLVITGPRGGVRWSQGLRTVFRGESGGEPLFELKVPRTESRPRYAPLDAKALRLDSSAGHAALAALCDRDPMTVWSTGRPATLGDWIEVAWSDPSPLARLELLIGDRPSREPALRILTRTADRGHQPVLAVPAREPLGQQIAAGRPVSLVFLVDPRPVTGLRIEVVDTPPEPWTAAELVLSVRLPARVRP